MAGFRLPQSIACSPVLKAYLSSDHISPATGKTIAVQVSKNKAAFGNPSAGSTNLTEIGNGWYYVDLSATDTGTKGPLIVRGTATGVDDVEIVYRVVDPHNADFDGVPAVVAGASGGLPLIGSAPLTNLDAAVSTRSTYAGADTSGTTTLLSRLTGTRSGLLDNLDAAISTRSSHSAAAVWAVGTRTLSAFGFSVDVATVGGATATVLTPPLAANLTQVGGQAIPTPNVAGVPIVDVGYALGEVVVTDSSTPDVNVIQWKGGTPNDLVSGRVDANATASLGATAPANWINAAALDPDVTTEIQAGLATSSALATVGGTATAIKAKTDNLPTTPAAVGSAMALQDGAITSAKVTVGTYSGVATGWIERMEQLWRRFFKPASRTPTQLRTFADNGTTVQTTQAISDDGSGTETQGAAS